MTVDDLSAIYRVERKSKGLSQTRRDLYPAMAALLAKTRADYEKQLLINPDSLVCEGTDHRRRKANQHSKQITEMRMEKICRMALIGAMGGQNALDSMTPEERAYYGEVVRISKEHCGMLDRMSGKKSYVIPDLDSDAVAAPPAPKAAAERAEKTLRDVPPEAFADEPDRFDEDPEDYVEMTPAAPSAPAAEPSREAGGGPPLPEPAPPDAAERAGACGTVVIRVLEDLPPFAGPDRDYALRKEDVLSMPREMADILVSGRKAVLLSPSP
jgi:DNA replication factor GINS